MSTSKLVFTTRTGQVRPAEHTRRLRLIASQARVARERAPIARPCREKQPEPHGRGEFPMSCYACQMVTDI